MSFVIFSSFDIFILGVISIYYGTNCLLYYYCFFSALCVKSNEIKDFVVGKMAKNHSLLCLGVVRSSEIIEILDGDLEYGVNNIEKINKYVALGIEALCYIISTNIKSIYLICGLKLIYCMHLIFNISREIFFLSDPKYLNFSIFFFFNDGNVFPTNLLLCFL